MDRERVLVVACRLALGFAFVYVGWSMFTNATAWLGYSPAFLENFIESTGLGARRFMDIEAILHVILGVWIISGRKIFIPTLLATIFLASIVYFNANQMVVLFRDVSLALVAAGLAWYSRGS